MIIHPRFFIRELKETRGQAWIFILCVALSIASLVALDSFRHDVDQTIIGDVRALHGGDIIVHSHYPFSSRLEQGVRSLNNSNKLDSETRSWELYSVVRKIDDSGSLFSSIKIVDEKYPLYGSVDLQSGLPFQEQLLPGAVVVAEELLEKLDLETGDFVKVGKTRLQIVDVIERESARPVNLFRLGPRLFVHAADLKRIDLVRTGSRVEHEWLFAIAPGNNPETLAEEIRQFTTPGQERVDTASTGRSRLKRFFDNLIFFLSLISIFTMLLAGIGIQSSLAALLRRKEKTLAIIRSLGATRNFLFSHYLLLVLCYGGIGAIVGIVGGGLIKYTFPLLFGDFLSAEQIGGLRTINIIKGLATCFPVVCFFAFLPLYNLWEMKPNRIFNRQLATKKSDILSWVVIGAGSILLTAFIIYRLEDVKTGIWFMAGSLALILLTMLFARAILWGGARISIRNLPARQAVRSLIRPGNSTIAVLVTLSSALSVLLLIYLIQSNLHQTYVQSYPKDAPNLFMIDIQPDQRQDFQNMVGAEVQLHPIIRARLKAINGVAIKKGQRKSRWSDSLSREFNLTYRDNLLDVEELIEGTSLYKLDSHGKPMLQVSILDMVAEMGDMKIGDVLDFNIQGIPLTAEITSIRTRTKSMLYPFFYFLFPEHFLQKAPQTLFAAVHVEKGELAELEKEVAIKFPNVSIINMAGTAAEFGNVMGRLSTIINFFALFSLVAGGLIVLSSIFATRLARYREIVYYKILGAGQRFVLTVYCAENLLLGLISSVLGVAIAQVGGWAICSYFFDIRYSPNWLSSVVLVFVTTFLVVIIGMGGSFAIMKSKPARFLREEFGD